MDDVTVACFQPRFTVLSGRDEFEALARRFLRQAKAQSAQLAVFPELTGMMLAPGQVSRLKLGLVKKGLRGRLSRAGFWARRLGRAAEAMVGGIGPNLVSTGRKGEALRELYADTFSGLAREFGIALVAGSLLAFDSESGALRNRAMVFDDAGEVMGYQDKLNLSPAERQSAVSGSNLTLFRARFGVFGILIGQDILYPELARLLAVQGADLLIGIAAAPGMPEGNLLRAAIALRAEENQVYAAASFLLGPSLLDTDERRDYYGQSALLAPIALTERGDGILAQVGSNRVEGMLTYTLRGRLLEELRETGRFRPRGEMNLAGLGTLLGQFYERGLTIQLAAEQGIAGPQVQPPSLPEAPEGVIAGPALPEPLPQDQAELSGLEERMLASLASIEPLGKIEVAPEAPAAATPPEEPAPPDQQEGPPQQPADDSVA